MMKIFGALILLFGLSAKAGVKENYNGLMKKVNSIYYSDAGRATNSLLWFYGNERWLTYYTSSRISRADVRMGSLLMATYDMYCRKRARKVGCLGRNLYINYRLTGSTKKGHKVISIKVNNQTIVSNYFIEAISKVYSALDSQFVDSRLTAYEQRIVHPAPKVRVKTRMIVLYPNPGTNNRNTKWLNNNGFRNNVFYRGYVNMFKLFRFPNRSEALVNHNDYHNSSQRSILYKYSNTRRNGQVTMVISGPGTTDSLGRTWQRYSSSPYFVARAIWNGGHPEYSFDNYNHASLVLLHELAHNMNLGHCSPGQTATMCTDNIWTKKSFAKNVFDYLKWTGALTLYYSI